MNNGVLEKLLGSGARVKIIRMFLLNPENIFTHEQISRRSKVPAPLTRREISLLKSITFIKPVEHFEEETIKLKSGETKIRRKKVEGLVLNNLFPFLHALRNLFLNVAPVDKEKVIKELCSVGRVKLLVFAGIFTHADNSRVDLLLVGDSVKETKLEKVLRNLEAEMGRELVYAVFNTEDFTYRMGMYDRFLRDILDYPHEKVVNKINLL
ncbi:hypothetical protein C4572_02655 [Candidatus Parcubacteria bacterium]|nr:MAG: hypothetical protein C4572_02655 [Candidatus Parcubacteria bacterium]